MSTIAAFLSSRHPGLPLDRVYYRAGFPRANLSHLICLYREVLHLKNPNEPDNHRSGNFHGFLCRNDVEGME